ncbi:MAG: hypothetical protein ACHQM4_09730 [Thermoanaerobaculia bacterium]
MTATAPGSGLVVALVEPTTLLGRDVRAVLTERKFPASRVHLFHQAAGDTGLLAADDDEVAFVAPLTHDALETSRIAFLCGSAAGTARFLATRADGALAIDLSGVRNGQELVVPSEGGESRPLPAGNLFLTPGPVAFVLYETIRLVETLAPVTEVTAAVDRPASELGKAALDELFQQALALATFRPFPKDVLETQAAFNFWVPPDSPAFEKSVADDLAALLGRPVPTAILSARGGVFHGHFLRIELRLAGDAPDASTLVASFRAQKHAFDIVDPEDLSGPVQSAGRDETLLLRCETSGRSVRLTLAADHLRRAGALLAVRLAEQAAGERGWLG